MARIKIADVPAAPSVAGAAPQPINYPNLPGQRVPTVTPNFGNLAQIPTDVGTSARFQAPREINPEMLNAGIDYEGAARKLQQPLMDAGPLLAAGEASMRAAAAIGTLGRSIGGAFMDLAEMGQSLQVSKDMADISRANNGIAAVTAAYNEAAVGVPLAQRQQLWEEEFKPKMDALIAAIKPSPYAADRIGTTWRLADTRQRTEIKTDTWKEMAKQDEAAILEEVDRAVANGDWAAAADANARLTLGKHQTPQQQSARQKQINEAQTEWNVQQLINTNPRAAFQEAQEAKAGGSDIFPDLKNPATIAKVEHAARTAMNTRETEAMDSVANGIVEGKIKTPEDIENAAAGNISAAGLATLKQGLYANPAYSSEPVTKIKTAIGAYDPKSDEDMAKRHAIYNAIVTQLPKDLQKPMLDELDQVIKDSEGGKFKTANQKTTTAIEQEIERLVDIGLIKEGNYDPAKAKKDPTGYGYKHREEAERLWQRVETYKQQMRKWMEDNEGDPSKAMDQLSEVIGVELKSNAKGATSAPRPAGLSEILPPAAARAQEKTTPGRPAPSFMVGDTQPKGMLERGNIDISNRPVAKNPDGSVSTEVSVSINENGKEILIPTVIDGKIVDIDAAIEHYHKTGEHLGKFDSVEAADAYAEKLHNRKAAPANGKTSSLSEPLVDRIKELEGYSGSAYDDGAQYSIGYGTRAKSRSETIDKAEADRRLRSELTAAARDVDAAAKEQGLELTPGQRDALISFHYNTGKGDYLIDSSGGSLAEISRRMQLYVNFKGKQNQGLVNRRRNELEMFNT